MIRTIIIDDERKSRETLLNMIGIYCPKFQIIGEAGNVENGVKLINSIHPQVVLLDIQMPDGTGFDLLRKIKNKNFKLIFITAYEEFAIKAFKFSAIDYLLKPVDPEDLVVTMAKAEKAITSENTHLKLQNLLENIDAISTENKKIVLKTSDSIHLIKVTDIIRCESSSNYTIFYLTNNTKIMISKTLKEYDDLLTEYDFIRIHQSHLVNAKHIESYEKSDGGSLIMKDKSKVPVSFRKKEHLLKLFDKL